VVELTRRHLTLLTDGRHPVDRDQTRDAVRARNMQADTPEDRHGVYPNRANRDELRARAALYPVRDRRVIALPVRPPEPPRSAA